METLFNLQKTKTMIIERIEINYSKSREFYSGLLLGFYLVDRINAREHEELKEWINNYRGLK